MGGFASLGQGQLRAASRAGEQDPPIRQSAPILPPAAVTAFPGAQDQQRRKDNKDPEDKKHALYVAQIARWIKARAPDKRVLP